MEVELIQDVNVIQVEGDLTITNAEVFKDDFLKIRGTRYLFDLSKLTMLDSTGLGAIVFCQRHVKENNASLAICGLNGKSKLVFDITRAHQIFDIFETRSAALEFLTHSN